MTSLEILQQPNTVAKMTAAILPVLRDRALAPIHVAAEAQEFARVLGLIKQEDLAQITPEEIERVAISSVATGLSWAADEGNFYLQPRNAKVIIPGNPPREVTEKRLELSITHRGETSLRQKQGIIKMLDGPHVIYDGDTYGKINFSKHTIEHEKLVPAKPNAKVVAVYEFIIMPDGSRLLRYFDQNDFDRWAGFSAKQNGQFGANKLYTSGPGGGVDPGFIGAKCIKHGFKGLPKCKTFGIGMEKDPDEIPHQTVWEDARETEQEATGPTQTAEVIQETKPTTFNF